MMTDSFGLPATNCLLLSFFEVGSSRREGVPAHVNLSASSMLMIAMQYTSNPGAYLLFGLLVHL